MAPSISSSPTGSLPMQAAQLSNWRASQGHSAMSVDVQDVYDEFGYGVVGAAPIHDFLAYAYTQWATAPSVVVLVGDGHYDPKTMRLRAGELPSALPGGGRSLGCRDGADNRYVTVVGDDALPDMMLGGWR